MPNQNQVKYVPAGTGPMYCGPGDRVSFLVTGAESHGGCFIVEGLAAPGGGPGQSRQEEDAFDLCLERVRRGGIMALTKGEKETKLQGLSEVFGR
jgi:hypothetical protein